jgi:hypothetical protein
MFTSSSRLLHGSGRISGYSRQLRYILGYDGSCAHDCPITDADSWKYDGACADECVVTHDHFSCKPCSRGDMHAIAYDAIMVNRCGRIDDDGIAQLRAHANRGHSKDLATSSQRGIWCDERPTMNDSQW